MTFEQLSSALARFRIGVAGCGGLGSNCAVALARSGIGTLVIADFDVVSLSNLNRQYYFHEQIGEKKVMALQANLHKINPSVEVVPWDGTLNASNISSVFAGCHVVVEAFDHADQKQMLLETLGIEMPSVPVISGVGVAGWGSSNAIRANYAGNLVICGDLVTEVGSECPPLAPRVGIAANMQANEVLEILLGRMESASRLKPHE